MSDKWLVLMVNNEWINRKCNYWEIPNSSKSKLSKQKRAGL